MMILRLERSTKEHLSPQWVQCSHIQTSLHYLQCQRCRDCFLVWTAGTTGWVWDVNLGCISWKLQKRRNIEHSSCSLPNWNLHIDWTKSVPLKLIRVNKFQYSEYRQKLKALSTQRHVEPSINRNRNMSLVWYSSNTVSKLSFMLIIEKAAPCWP